MSLITFTTEYPELVGLWGLLLTLALHVIYWRA